MRLDNIFLSAMLQHVEKVASGCVLKVYDVALWCDNGVSRRRAAAGDSEGGLLVKHLEVAYWQGAAGPVEEAWLARLGKEPNARIAGVLGTPPPAIQVAPNTGQAGPRLPIVTRVECFALLHQDLLAFLCGRRQRLSLWHDQPDWKPQATAGAPEIAVLRIFATSFFSRQASVAESCCGLQRVQTLNFIYVQEAD